MNRRSSHEELPVAGPPLAEPPVQPLPNLNLQFVQPTLPPQAPGTQSPLQRHNSVPIEPQPHATIPMPSPPTGTNTHRPLEWIHHTSTMGTNIEDLPKWRRKLHRFRRRHATYYRLHMVWMVTVALLGSIVIHYTTSAETTYIDALYWASTAHFVVGLAPADIETLSRFGQVTMWFLALIGSPVFMSLIPVIIRRRAFKKVLLQEFGVTRAGKLRRKGGDAREDVDLSDFALERTMTGQVDDNGIYEEFDTHRGSGSGNPWFSKVDLRRLPKRAESSGGGKGFPKGLDLWPTTPKVADASTPGEVLTESPVSVASQPPDIEGEHIEMVQSPQPMETEPKGILLPERTHDTLVDAGQSTIQRRRNGADEIKFATEPTGEPTVNKNPPPGQPFVRTQSNAASLLVPDKHVLEQVGGVEYRALQSLETLIPAFYFGTQLLVFLFIRTYLHLRPALSARISSTVSPWWFSLFNAVSTFNQVGITLLNDGATSFGNEPVLMAFLCIPLVIGNTGFPVMLRVLIWALERFAEWRGDANRARVYRYLLKYPRRCFTNLFDHRQTLFLVCTLLFLNLLQFACSLALDMTDPAFDGVSRFVHFFQSVATRNGGFQVVGFAGLHPAMLWVYVGMMYLSSTYPVSVTIRRTTNTSYNHRELVRSSTQSSATSFSSPPTKPKPTESSIAQMRLLMLNDIVSIFAIIFLILVFEDAAVGRQGGEGEGGRFTMFALVFEVVSAYGNVGYSLGTPTHLFSLSGTWTTASKLAIIAAMCLGRHRGLPSAVDQTVRLPTRKAVTRTRVVERETGREVG
ncbi:cation transport protein-domain-containing protein, partial [Fimicolochytrium jonesii]|uniref:cation transport protein-domain-containing protein n=1 Tax=Fimicolochytrium jonesii TaxID=1396493 RepID=UPI0022FE5F6F